MFGIDNLCAFVGCFRLAAHAKYADMVSDTLKLSDVKSRLHVGVLTHGRAMNLEHWYAGTATTQ